MDCVSIVICLVAAVSALVPTVTARKCYTCDSLQGEPCVDGHNTQQLRQQDCSTGGYNQYPQTGFPNNNPNQPQYPMQPNYGGGDRCMKIVFLGGQGVTGGGMGGVSMPRIWRGCSNQAMQVAPTAMQTMTSSDSCTYQNLGGIGGVAPPMQICSCDSDNCNSDSQYWNNPPRPIIYKNNAHRSTSCDKPIFVTIALIAFLASLLYRRSA